MPRRRKPADPLRWFDSVLEVIRLVTPSPALSRAPEISCRWTDGALWGACAANRAEAGPNVRISP